MSSYVEYYIYTLHLNVCTSALLHYLYLMAI